MAALAGCNPTDQSPPEADAQASAIGSQPLSPIPLTSSRAEQPVSLANRPNAGSGLGSPEIVLGTGRFVSAAGSSSSQQVNLVGSDVSLDFTNVDIRDVLKSVLGDLLKLSYTVDPQVQGTITLQTGRPIPRSTVIDVLNTTLGLSGVALVNRDGLYLAVPVANAVRQAPIRGSDGFVTRIVPLQYVAASDLQQALESLVPPGATLRADPTQNILIVSGSARDVGSIMDNIEAFDVDYLRGLSFALLPLTNGSAKSVANDVGNLLKAAGPSVANMVKVVPIDRMNAVLVTSMQPSYLQRVREWVQRFDRGDGRTDQQLFVYRVQNGRATDIARVLRRALGIAGSDGGGDQQGPGSSDGDTSSTQSAGGASPSGLDVVKSVVSGTTPPGTGGPGSPQLQSDPLASVGAAAALGAGGATDSGSDVRVTADRANNALIVTATAQEYAPIEAALEKLDIPPLQVLIDATVAEVTLTNDLQLGLQYYFNSGNVAGVFRARNKTPSDWLGRTDDQQHVSGHWLLVGLQFRLLVERYEHRTAGAFAADHGAHPVVAEPARSQQWNGAASGRQSGADCHAVGHQHADRHGADGQCDQLQRHRRNPEHHASRQCQRARAARHDGRGQSADHDDLVQPQFTDDIATARDEFHGNP